MESETTHTGKKESISLSFQTSLLVLPLPGPLTLVKWLSHIICAFVANVLLLDEAGAASTARPRKNQSVGFPGEIT